MSNYPGDPKSKAIHDEKTEDQPRPLCGQPVNTPEDEITLLWHTADVLAGEIERLKCGRVYVQNLHEIKMLVTRMHELAERLEFLLEGDNGTPRG
jgi:hypothetical protein